jgi:hypothetical protein
VSRTAWIAAAAALVLAGGSGFLASQALGVGAAQATRTVTVNVGTGERGPAGPAGPAGPRGERGPPGGTTCPNGFAFGVLVINHPGGQTRIFTCLESP